MAYSWAHYHLIGVLEKSQTVETPDPTPPPHSSPAPDQMTRRTGGRAERTVRNA